MPDFSTAKYLSFETYRKNGTAVATPVWFAAGDDGLLYIYSEKNAGKVKRTRNNPNARIAPCDMRGKLRGEWVPATARILTDASEISRADGLLDQKYGLVRKLGGWFSKTMGRERDFIAIRLG